MDTWKALWFVAMKKWDGLKVCIHLKNHTHCYHKSATVHLKFAPFHLWTPVFSNGISQTTLVFKKRSLSLGKQRGQEPLPTTSRSHLPPPHSASLAPFATRELTFHTLPTPPLWAHTKQPVHQGHHSPPPTTNGNSSQLRTSRHNTKTHVGGNLKLQSSMAQQQTNPEEVPAIDTAWLTAHQISCLSCRRIPIGLDQLT